MAAVRSIAWRCDRRERFWLCFAFVAFRLLLSREHSMTGSCLITLLVDKEKSRKETFRCKYINLCILYIYIIRDPWICILQI